MKKEAKKASETAEGKKDISDKVKNEISDKDLDNASGGMSMRSVRCDVPEEEEKLPPT